MRGMHPVHVFTYRGKPIKKIYGARHGAKLVKGWPAPGSSHDLKHTFGRRLRSAGVSFEDRQDLLGHTSGRITSHYSQAELGNLIAAANKVCG